MKPFVPVLSVLLPVLLIVLATTSTAQEDLSILDFVEHNEAMNGDVKLHYAQMGEGPLVVMIHGFPDYWYTWRHQMAGLSEMKFVIDEQGQMLGVTVDGQSVDFGNLSAGSQFGGFGSGTPFLGPELPDGVVAEGDAWSTTWDTEFVPGREILVSADSRVLAVEGDVYVIETETTTSAIEMTMDDLLAASSTEEFDMTELAGMGDMSMTMSMDATTGTSTVWFDVSRGIPVRQEWSGGSATSMSMNAAGESGAMDMEMSFSGTLELRG